MNRFYRTTPVLAVSLGVALAAGPPHGVHAASVASASTLPQRFFAELSAAERQAQPDTKARGAPQPDIPLPEGKGMELTRKLCSTCHSNNVWANQRHTPEKWSSIIDNMVSKGLEASDDDLATVNDYLAVHFAPVSKDAPASKDAPPPPNH